VRARPALFFFGPLSFNVLPLSIESYEHLTTSEFALKQVSAAHFLPVGIGTAAHLGARLGAELDNGASRNRLFRDERRRRSGQPGRSELPSRPCLSFMANRTLWAVI
jgi:hypothetical protein